MRRFALRATWAHRVRTTWFTADNDRMALADGGFEVLAQIANAQGSLTRDVWRFGYVELINDLGVILAEMPAKEYANGGV